ncbi:hypothetical protein NQ317_008064, partial [Molorchus minor]
MICDTGNLKTKIPHRKPVYGLSVNRENDNILATAGDDGRILLFDLRESSNQEHIKLLRISHDYSDQSTSEDAKMMAFFDSLVQREIEGWISTSDDSLTSDSDNDMSKGLSKYISRIFKNGKNTSEEPKKHKANRIAQLISKKKNRLAKMAHNKSSSSIK